MATKPVIADTSVWIEYFKGRNAVLCGHLEELISHRQLRQIHVITAELIRGSLHTREKNAIMGTVAHIPVLPLPDSFWLTVGEFTFHLARKGVSAHLIDAWIAQAAILHRCTLWSLDKHFKQISEVSALEIV